MSLTVFDFLTTSHICLLRWKVYWAADISTTDHLHHLTVIVILSIKAETLGLSANQSLLFFSVRPIRKPQAFLIDHPVGRTSEFPAWPGNIEIKIIDQNTEITMTDQSWQHKNYDARSTLKRRSLTSFSGGHWTRDITREVKLLNQGEWLRTSMYCNALEELWILCCVTLNFIDLCFQIRMSVSKCQHFLCQSKLHVLRIQWGGDHVRASQKQSVPISMSDLI